MVIIEADLAILSLTRGEDDALHITSSIGQEDIGNGLYFVGLMFEGMARQFGGFLGSFVDFDARFLALPLRVVIAKSCWLWEEGDVFWVSTRNSSVILEGLIGKEGIENPRAIQRLRYILREMNPDVAFFYGKNLQSSRMKNIWRSCGFTNGIEVCSDGTRGDFNKITFSSEKQGGRLQDEHSIEAFHST
ncbi:hypothetical protein Gorai_021489, partial [Gossypium raimondii]|nr:hypothetical protein [Gossypium raimondii]